MRIGANSHRIKGAVIVAVQVFRFIAIAPGETVAIGATGRFFSFELGRQAPMAHALAAQPGGIGHGVMMGDHDHRMIIPVEGRSAFGPGMAPSARIGVDQAVTGPGIWVHVREMVKAGR